jgi:hypothetical protein
MQKMAPRHNIKQHYGTQQNTHFEQATLGIMTLDADLDVNTFILCIVLMRVAFLLLRQVSLC